MKIADSDSDGVDDTEEVADCDVCDEETIRRVFNLKCEAVTNQAIDKDKYILYLDGTLYVFITKTMLNTATFYFS